jgi:hypothetical protein
MSQRLKTNVGSHEAIRQIKSTDGWRVFSTVRTGGGFRFIEEANTYEPAGPGYEAYWYWQITSESGLYATEPEAFEDGVKALSWLKAEG